MSLARQSRFTDLTVVIWIGGDLLVVEHEAAELLEALNAIEADGNLGVEWVLVLDGPQWGKVLAPSAWAARAAERRVVALPHTSHHPGLLVNRGVETARGEFVAFLWPGCDTAGRKPLWRQMINAARKENCDLVGGRRPPAEMRSSPFDSWLPAEEESVYGYSCGWLQMQSLVPMSNCVVRRSALHKTGGLPTSILFQRYAWWAWCYRASRHVAMRELKLSTAACRWGLHDYPWQVSAPFSADLAARAMSLDCVGAAAVGRETVVHAGGVAELARDLDGALARRLLSQTGRLLKRMPAAVPAAPDAAEERDGGAKPGLALGVDLPREPLRITLLGGLSEPAHNYFCFFSFFERLAGRGVLNWRVVFDRAATTADIAEADLVILSRVRSDNGRRLLEYCRAHQRPTLYLLNDNWFWLAKDRPEEYADVLAPGKPAYENFLACCREATAVMTQNALIAEDVTPHARRVVMVDPSINLEIFPRPQRRTTERLRIGFMGTPRWDEGPFQALVAVVRKRPEVDLFLMSPRVPEAVERLPATRLIYRPYVFDYRQFARICAAEHPDVLIAPLEDNRSQASKCPNKYFDITGVGAAGVYSNLAPYARFIRDGENGLLVDNGERGWREAIERLLEDDALRARIVRNAQGDVRSNYATDVVLPRFLEALLSVVRPGDGGGAAGVGCNGPDLLSRDAGRV